MTTYPEQPGFKERGFPTPSTSQDAAASMVSASERLRRRILNLMKAIPKRGQWEKPPSTKIVLWHGWTPDEVADHWGMSVLNVRPRFTELQAQGLIERTGERRPSSIGHPQNVYRLKEKP